MVAVSENDALKSLDNYYSSSRQKKADAFEPFREADAKDRFQSLTVDTERPPRKVRLAGVLKGELHSGKAIKKELIIQPLSPLGEEGDTSRNEENDLVMSELVN